MKKILFLVPLTLLISCGEPNLLDVDVSTIDLTIPLNRFEKEFFEADKYKLRELNEEWTKKYGILYESFIFDMLNEGSVHEPMIVYRLERFLNDSAMQQVYGSLKEKFGNFTPYHEKLTDGFKHYKYHFKDSAIPSITTFYSNFNAKVFPTKDNIAIGIDLFLGKESDIVKRLSTEYYPAYLKTKMEPQFLVTETMKYWLYYKFANPTDFRNYSIYIIEDDFLSTIILHGKMLYTLKAMFPNEDMEVLFGYTPEQLTWCEENEHFIYQKLVEDNLIYSKNQKDISRYINDGPFTTGLSDESPSMVGCYIGYSIVKQFMERNQKLTLPDLLYKKTNEREIFKGYKP